MGPGKQYVHGYPIYSLSWAIFERLMKNPSIHRHQKLEIAPHDNNHTQTGIDCCSFFFYFGLFGNSRPMTVEMWNYPPKLGSI
jgi:hypothetical protein